ncbi:pentapeptide repeat-containing protein [Telluribacter sp. SYSU D00476]|uniref:pentapeptide repeat-containing protein n=1 Tax=Telluribacter sp. SYSU D00476 TaxID=2811430 RepID=UPI001FF440AB|nr:pentapeptide repeat-containing protein [Telluribacter sp. SYSU D00476]
MKTTFSYFFSLALVALLAVSATAQSTLSAKEIIQNIDRKFAVEVNNKTIEGDLDLTELSNKELKKRGNMDTREYKSRVEVPITFRNCTFRGDVVAYKVVGKDGKRRGLLGSVMNNDGDDQTLYTADFKEAVVFENCTFEGLAEFKYSDFAEKVSFADSKFRHQANFKYAKFNEGARFANVDFTDSANFKYAKFSDEANFANTRISQVADFKYANFQDGVTFKGTHFQGYADFKYTDFKREGDLSQVTFSRGSDFKYAKGSRYISTN